MCRNKHPFGELTELHVHVGSAVDIPIMWEIAHERGIKLPTKDYWEFKKLITVSGKITYDKYLELFYWTEIIQSSPDAMSRSVYSIASGAYRKNNITTLEIRFNPMKRNREGERDLDHIILASIHGMEKAMMTYPVKAGLILCLDRTFPPKLNQIIAEKAIKYRERGVVGVDLAGPIDENFDLNAIASMAKECKRQGLGVTIHTGEATGANEVWQVVELVSPDRIGHGVRAVEDEKLLDELAKREIVLEICPSSNLHTGVVKDLEEFRDIFSKLKDHKVRFTINTDGPEMIKTNLLNEYKMLLKNDILEKEDLFAACRQAKRASFIK